MSEVKRSGPAPQGVRARPWNSERVGAPGLLELLELLGLRGLLGILRLRVGLGVRRGGVLDLGFGLVGLDLVLRRGVLDGVRLDRRVLLEVGVLARALGGRLGLPRRLLGHGQRFHQLDDGHRRVVAAAVADLGDPGVATRPVLVPRADLGEERVHDALVRDRLQHLATVVHVALLRLGDQALRDRAQTARLGLGGGDAAVLEEGPREVREKQLLVRGAAAQTGTLGGLRHVFLLLRCTGRIRYRCQCEPAAAGSWLSGCARRGAGNCANSHGVTRRSSPSQRGCCCRIRTTGRWMVARKRTQYCSVSTKPASTSSSAPKASAAAVGSNPGGLSLRARPMPASFALTSSIDFAPKLRMSSRSASERATSSPTEWMPSRLRQLYERTVSSSSSIGSARSAASAASVGDGPMSMPSASMFSSRARPNSSTRVLPALATASRGRMDGLVSTSRMSLSKSVRCSTRVASTL